MSPGIAIPKLPHPRGPAEPSEISKCQRTDFQSLTLVSGGTAQPTAVVDPSRSESPQPRFEVAEGPTPSLVVGVGISAPLVRVEDFCSELQAGLVAEVTQMPIIGSRIVLSRDQGVFFPNVWLSHTHILTRGVSNSKGGVIVRWVDVQCFRLKTEGELSQCRGRWSHRGCVVWWIEATRGICGSKSRTVES